MGRIAKFMRLSGAEKRLFAEAVFCLAVARCSIMVFPFRWIARHLGRSMAESPAQSDPAHARMAGQIAHAIERASRHAPWQCRCLVQAIACKMMLRRRKIPSTFYLGVVKESDDTLSAHAWLRCGESILTGAAGRNRCTVVGTFAEDK